MNKLKRFLASIIFVLFVIDPITDLEFLREFKSRSKLTKHDALRLGREVNERLSKRYL